MYLHGTATRVLTSGHPPETIITRVLTYDHSPGSLQHDISSGIEDLQVLTGIAAN